MLASIYLFIALAFNHVARGKNGFLMTLHANEIWKHAKTTQMHFIILTL